MDLDPAQETLFEFLFDGKRDQAVDVTAKPDHLFYQFRTNEGVSFSGHHKHCFDLGCEAAIRWSSARSVATGVP